jgi:hypothetical protein
VRSEVESRVVWLTEVSGSAHLNLAHLELISDGGSRYTEVSLVKLLHVKYNEGF